jgi:hypothetical protein
MMSGNIATTVGDIHQAIIDRNIKTAGASRRVSSSQVNSPPVGTSYDFNKIKKDLDSVR